MAKRKKDDDDLVGGHHTADGSNGSNTENVAAAELRSFVERIERLEEEKGAIGSDIKDVYGEAKGRGYDTKAIRKIVSERKQDANERLEFETILDVYRAALGMAHSGDED
jgi:uncharacterized protein (UPF0335 family)